MDNPVQSEGAYCISDRAVSGCFTQLNRSGKVGGELHTPQRYKVVSGLLNRNITLSHKQNRLNA